MRTPILFTVLTLFSLLLAGCGAPEPAPVASGLTITAETNPTPARVGDVEIVLTVKDAQGKPITGAFVYIFADHTDMTGMTMNGQAAEQGDGRYSIKANFSMSGNWKLNVEVKQGEKSVLQEVLLEIE